MNRFTGWEKDADDCKQNDTKARFYKVDAGQTVRVRILPNPDSDKFYLRDAYHKVSDKYFDCTADDECAICTFSKAKTPRFQLQVVVMSQDGKEILIPETKLLSVTRSCMKYIFDAMEQGIDPLEKDFVIARKSSNNFDGTCFTDREIDISNKVMSTMVKLDSNRNYFRLDDEGVQDFLDSMK